MAVDFPPEFFGLSAHTLAGPTGERNVYQVQPRAAILCLAQTEDSLLMQLAAVLTVGSRAVWDGRASLAVELHRRLPVAVQACIQLSPQWALHDFDAALFHGDEVTLLEVQQTLARRPGAVVPLSVVRLGESVPLERLVVERAVSLDTTAAGGNASLMTLA